MNFHGAKVFSILSLLFIILTFPSLGEAATFCVNDQADNGVAVAGDCPDAACNGSSGACSLRDAIAAANGGGDSDIITFSTSLTSPLMISNTADLDAIINPVEINGPGPTIDANGNSSVFIFDGTGLSFSVSGLTITGGAGEQIDLSAGSLTLSNCTVTGGPGSGVEGEDSLTIRNSTISNNDVGVFFFGGNLTIENSTFSDNTNSQTNFSVGGALHVGGGTVTISNSTFSGNTANDTVPDNGGGAIGIYNDGVDTTVEMTNVTISGNRANANGGGLWISNACTACGTASPLNATLTNVTIAENMANLDSPTGAETGGGLYVALLAGSSVTLNNVLIGNNSGGASPDCLVDLVAGAEPLTSNGFNLVEDPTGCTVLESSDITGQDPLLAALNLNAPGTTSTQALDSGSPALDAGDNASCPSTDQRGIPRPQGPACDIGAYEAVICGDGTEAPGEECESGPCCDTATCLFSPDTTPCNVGSDSEGFCDGSGNCVPDSGGCSLGLAGSGYSGQLGLAWMLMSLAAWYFVRRRDAHVPLK